jgi:Mrp family chromosome partitioning ATPase
VIEANALKPDPRYEEPFLPGLVELLSGEGDAEACIQPAEGLLPDRIGVGFSGLMHLHNYGVLPGILEQLQPRYPVIFIDAPPVLLSADTEYLASIADITLLLVAALRTLPGDIRRTVDVLRKIDPRTIGFIVTRLERFRGGGYYDKMIREHMDAEQAARDVLKSHPLRQSPEST